MKTIRLSYDQTSRNLVADDGMAGTAIDNGVVRFHIDRLPHCTMDLVYGVVLRDGKKLQGHPFSRLDSSGECVLYADVLTACTGGALPVYLKITHADNTVECSRPCVFKVFAVPNGDLEAKIFSSDLMMTRNSSWEWDERWTYPKGAIVSYKGAMWVAIEEVSIVSPEISPSWKSMELIDGDMVVELLQKIDALTLELKGKKPIESADVLVPVSKWTPLEPGWTASIEIPGVIDDMHHRVAPLVDYEEACAEYGVRASCVQSGQLILLSDDKPSVDVGLNLLQMDVKKCQ